jgi:hypothetical protein
VLGKRKDEWHEMWVATTDLLKLEEHVFYRKLNRVLAEAGAIVNSCVREVFQAATWGTQIPSMKIVPRRTSTSTYVPFKSLHLFEADCISLYIIVRQAIREPLPLVRFVRSRTVANVDSIGLVVRR